MKLIKYEQKILFKDNMPRYKQIITPSTEPVSLETVKNNLKIDNNNTSYDQILNSLIISSRQKIENYLEQSLITQTWQMLTNQYNNGEIKLLKAPVQSIDSVEFVDNNQESTVIDTEKYYLEEDYLFLKEVKTASKYIKINYKTGYGDQAEDIPDIFRQAILEEVLYHYHNQDKIQDKLSDDLSPLALKLLRPYKKHHV